MACYTEIRFPKATPWENVEKYVRELLTDKFGEGFTIKVDVRGGIDIYFNDDDWDIPHLEYFFVGKMTKLRRLQWSDNCFRQLDGGWFANWLSCKIAEHFKGMIYSESLDEKWKPKFHEEYPTAYVWQLEKDHGFLSRLVGRRVFRERMRELKKVLPARVYKVFAEK